MRSHSPSESALANGMVFDDHFILLEMYTMVLMECSTLCTHFHVDLIILKQFDSHMTSFTFYIRSP
jgi:hypothetical protein